MEKRLSERWVWERWLACVSLDRGEAGVEKGSFGARSDRECYAATWKRGLAPPSRRKREAGLV
jgi:hypothetical protein